MDVADWRVPGVFIGTFVVGATASLLMTVPDVVRVMANCAAVLALGLATAPWLVGEPLRSEMRTRATSAFRLVCGVWVSAELTRCAVSAAEAAGVGLAQLSVNDLLRYTTQTASGRAVLVALCAAAACLALALSATWPVAAAVVATVGMASRALAGHAAVNTFGVLAVALHAVAAALWCGVLVAMLVTVRGRTGWARALPGFSRLAACCVAVLLTSGFVAAAEALDSPQALYATGYGRLLIAKLVLAVVLVAVGWRNRVFWVPAAKRGSISARRSRRRASAEGGLLALAVGAGAVLAVTG